METQQHVERAETEVKNEISLPQEENQELKQDDLREQWEGEWIDILHHPSVFNNAKIKDRNKVDKIVLTTAFLIAGVPLFDGSLGKIDLIKEKTVGHVGPPPGAGIYKKYLTFPSDKCIETLHSFLISIFRDAINHTNDNEDFVKTIRYQMSNCYDLLKEEQDPEIVDEFKTLADSAYSILQQYYSPQVNSVNEAVRLVRPAEPPIGHDKLLRPAQGAEKANPDKLLRPFSQNMEVYDLEKNYPVNDVRSK